MSEDDIVVEFIDPALAIPADALHWFGSGLAPVRRVTLPELAERFPSTGEDAGE